MYYIYIYNNHIIVLSAFIIYRYLNSSFANGPTRRRAAAEAEVTRTVNRTRGHGDPTPRGATTLLRYKPFYADTTTTILL